jgi:hypothetical protein
VEVLFWNGKTDLNEADDGPVQEIEIPEPPERVMEIHARQDYAMRKFALNPEDKEAKAIINHLNYLIIQDNENDEDMKKAKADKFLWCTELSFFYPQFLMALQNYNTIANDPTNETAKDDINKLRALINQEIKRKHYPTSWTIPTPDDYLKAKRTIEEILNCGPEEYNKILGITDDTSKDDVEDAFEARGRLVHPDHMKQLAQAEEAFKSTHGEDSVCCRTLN